MTFSIVLMSDPFMNMKENEMHRWHHTEAVQMFGLTGLRMCFSSI